MLELITLAETKIQQQMDSTPWHVRMFMYPEYRHAERALSRMRKLRASDIRDESWYLEYATATHHLFDAVDTGIDVAFRTYNEVKEMPYIGPQVTDIMTSNWNQIATTIDDKLPQLNTEAHSIHPRAEAITLPTARQIKPILSAGREFGLAALATQAAEDTGKSIEHYRTAFLSIETEPPSGNYWLRDAFMGVMRAAAPVLDVLFGGQTYEPV